MSGFRFQPELLDHRAQVIEALNEHGFDWLSHYSSVDPLHDLYGMEVYGIVREEDAQGIKDLLIALYPEWHYSRVYLKDWGLAPGWLVEIHRDPKWADADDFWRNEGN